MASAPVPLEPAAHRGMNFDSFDRNAFKLDIDVVAARVPTLQVGKMKKELASAILTISRVTSVVQDVQSNEYKLLLLNKPTRDQLPAEALEVLMSNNIETVPHRITLGYEYWNATQILRAMLPEELLEDLPTSFTIVGHIAHFNLRDEYLPYKHLIGQVILDKNPTIETVVNKLDSIDNEFRFFQMEVLAGKPEFKVTTSENGCQFRFDFSKVYWNSRLQTEHTRLVDSFDIKDVIADGFAGVGPFAVPAAAKKGCLGVLANDLNPMSAEGLRENVKLNKVEDLVRCYNMDGRHFFRQAVKELYDNPFPARAGPRVSASRAAKQARHEREQKKKGIQQSETETVATTSSVNGKEVTSAPSTTTATTTTASLPGRFVAHCILNLPATALEFLDGFQELYTPFVNGSQEDRKIFLEQLAEYSKSRCTEAWDGQYRFPMVHCYCFTKEVEEYEKDICERATKSLGYPVSSSTLKDFSVSLVRSVAPKKDMYRLSFRLPREVVFKGASEMP